MKPKKYQKLAKRTECDQKASAIRYNRANENCRMIATRLNHAALGLSGEAGEVCAVVERWLHYNQDLDIPNLQEELGDCMWYIALACSAVGIRLDDVMKGNIAKLKERYPDAYTDVHAKEENRDRKKEMEALELEARRISKNPFICPECGGHISDEVVRKLNSPKYKSDMFHCPECKVVLIAAELVPI